MVPSPNLDEVQDDGIEGNVPEVNVRVNDVEKGQDYSEDQPPSAPITRFEKGHIPSNRYPSIEYVFLTDERKPKCFEESIVSDDRKL